NGKEIWAQPGSNVFSVGSTIENGSAKIVHTDGDDIILRSTNGDKLRTLKLPFISFAIERWPKAGLDPVIVGMHESTVKAFDFKGTLVGSLPIRRDGTDLSTATFAQGSDTFLAVVVSLLASSGLSELYIFDQRDTLLYHEVFKGGNPAVAAGSAMSGSENFLLVGGADGTVIEYRMRRKVRSENRDRHQRNANQVQNQSSSLAEGQDF
ncbi:MAG: hypothetical protein ABI623_09635, partial [bacterium]